MLNLKSKLYQMYANIDYFVISVWEIQLSQYLGKLSAGLTRLSVNY